MLELRVPPVVATFVVAAAMWSVSLVGPVLHGARLLRGGLAVVLAAAGLGIALAGVLQFRRARTTVNPLHPERATAMVTDGIYGRTRNPMYLGLLLVLAGWAAWLGSALALPGLPVFVGWMTRHQIRPEERALAARFPDEFARYARSVRRWV